MFRGIIVLSALAAGLSTVRRAGCSPFGGRRLPAGGAPAVEGIQLAQYGDVEIYYDEFGRRVVVDAYTGEVLAVERPRRAERLQRREAMRERPSRRSEERYYLDDPEDMERLRRQKLRDAGIIPAPPIDDYEDYSRRGLPEGLDDEYRGSAPRVSG